MADVTIEVDGLPVEVDASEYDNPTEVVENVRAARRALQLGDDVPEAEDWDAIVGDDA